MSDEINLDWGDLKEAASKIKQGAELVRSTAEAIDGALEAFGFGVQPSTTRRDPDGGYTVNGVRYPGTVATFGERFAGLEIQNQDLPDWFPFAELVQAQLLVRAHRANPSDPKLAAAPQYEPIFLASFLVDWALAGATEEEILELANQPASYGLPDEAESPQIWRQTLAGEALITAIACRVDLPKFNTWWRGWRQTLESWNSSPPPWQYCQMTRSEPTIIDGPGCIGINRGTRGESLDALDARGRMVIPGGGDFLVRAEAMINMARTNTVQTLPTQHRFQDFETCIASGDPACLAQFPASSEFWTRLAEPWRLGYQPGKVVQIVENQYGKFLAWDLGKPRGISMRVAVAISTPLVLGVAAIAAATWYLKRK